MQLLEPEANVDIPLRDYDYKDVYEKAKIACATALRLNEMGMPIELEEEDDLFAKQVITQEVKPTTKQIFKPGVAIKLGALLEEYEVELIGKIADVGLFAERTQITIINKSTEELERELVGLFKDYVDVEAREVTKVEQLMSEEVQDVEEIKSEEQEVEDVDAEDK
jgi:hypothetical protein